MWNVLRWWVAALAAGLLALAACGGRAVLGNGDELGSGGEPSLGGASSTVGAGGQSGSGGRPNGRGGAGGMGIAGMPAAGGYAGNVNLAGAGGMPAAGGSFWGAGGMMPGAGGAGIGGRASTTGQGAGGMPAMDYGTLNGRVVDAETDEALEGVSITFLAANGTVVGYAVTHSDGTYSVELPSGRVYAYFRLEGYLPTTGEFEVQPGLVSEASVTRLVPIGDEVTGGLSGYVLDAETTEPIANAQLRVRAGVNATQGTVIAQATTDSEGRYVFEDLDAGNYTVEGSVSGYAKAFVDATVTAGTSSEAPDLLLSRVLESGQIRIVLTWGLVPEDLDAHLYVPPMDEAGFEDGFEVFYGARGTLDGPPFAELDVDDTSSYGPETITIDRTVTGTYHYLVHRFSDDASFSDSEAQVNVYDESGLAYTAYVPGTGSGDYWHVLDIDGETLVITPINQRSSIDPFE